ncbi:soluble lytic murein transglycosylase precursor [Clostridium acetireducens DSM 10703]|uniref:Soluble lytic murein transglycosylase n=1 Tax=Clostridium acetireducens DSM 10703 TaxID=1121290 RepID=A0A1E8F1A9_9CLOT|nr:soluble lytic murein transglycosylase precursor [Clostridium acetireducens DSM 10703]
METISKDKISFEIESKLKFIKKLLIFIIIFVFILNAKNVAKIFFPLKYKNSVVNYSKEFNLDPYLVAAVIKTESNFNLEAKSNKNAYGLMQITSDTGEWAAEKMGIKDFHTNLLYDPQFNIRMGCWYLDNLRKEFNGNMDLVLAAYNGGRGNVQKWLNDSDHSLDGQNLHNIPFKETEDYLKKVKLNYKIYKFLYGSNTKQYTIYLKNLH